MRAVLFAGFCLGGVLAANPAVAVACSGRDDCAPTEWCSFPEGNICGAKGPGECKPRPEICTREYRPVCACNANDYPNACTAHAAGTDIARLGRCRE